MSPNRWHKVNTILYAKPTYPMCKCSLVPLPWLFSSPVEIIERPAEPAEPAELPPPIFSPFSEAMSQSSITTTLRHGMNNKAVTIWSSLMSSEDWHSCLMSERPHLLTAHPFRESFFWVCCPFGMWRHYFLASTQDLTPGGVCVDSRDSPACVRDGITSWISWYLLGLLEFCVLVRSTVVSEQALTCGNVGRPLRGTL